MNVHISLNGADWHCKGYVGRDWYWRNAYKPDTGDVHDWIAAAVPGCVSYDLLQAGEIPNPYYERNSLLTEWVPQRTWLYKKTFTVDAHHRDRRVYLCFEGVDYEAEFFLNGEVLGSHRGMYTPVVFDVGDKLRYGEENLIAVAIKPSPQEQSQIGHTSAVRTHKARMNYWWDFCPRMLHQGIWDDVYLSVSDAVRITDVWAMPQLEADYTQATVTVQTTVDVSHATSVLVETTLFYEGSVVAQTPVTCRVKHGTSQVPVVFNILDPHLWWPNGAGDQPLYQAQVKVFDLDVERECVSDERQVTFGIRHIAFVPNEGAGAAARSYTLTVNGCKLFIKGWNWVPLDAMYGVPRPEKLARLLTMAQDANVNLLRVWGGGLIEREDFYALCDRLGLLVWQEFVQSSSGLDNVPADDEDFVTMMVDEAVQIIPRKRNHPSLAIWCAGNELMSAPNTPLDERHPVVAALRDVVVELDPDRHWLPTSPSGPEFSNALDVIARNPLGMHDVHGPWVHQGPVEQFALYNQGQSLLHSEFGVAGITNYRTLNALIAPKHQWPISLQNPLWMHLASWWVHNALWAEFFGDFPDVYMAVKATQWIQADGLRYAIEADRRRKWHNSGTLPWQFNEPYPMASCTSAVDYYGQPKPAYYAVARAYEPVHVSAAFARQVWAGEQTFVAELWLSNSGAASLPASLSWRVLGAGGTVYVAQQQSVTLAAASATPAGEVRFDLANLAEDIFFLDLCLTGGDGEVISRNRYVFSRTENMRPLLDMEPAALAVDVATGEEVWSVTINNVGDVVALFVWLDYAHAVTDSAANYGTFEDNYFSLFPGESRTIALHWRHIAEKNRQLTAVGWNTGTYVYPVPV